jgi:hypothetical protein
LALNESSPGKHDWFHRLSGDWAIKIGDTDFEIGNSLDTDSQGIFRVSHWVPFVRKDGNESFTPKTLIDGVVSFHHHGDWILFQTNKGWASIQITTGNLKEADNIKELADSVPNSLLLLSDNMKIPMPSNKVGYHIISSTLFIISLFLFIRMMLQKNHSMEEGGNTKAEKPKTE